MLHISIYLSIYLMPNDICFIGYFSKINYKILEFFVKKKINIILKIKSEHMDGECLHISFYRRGSLNKFPDIFSYGQFYW